MALRDGLDVITAAGSRVGILHRRRRRLALGSWGSRTPPRSSDLVIAKAASSVRAGAAGSADRLRAGTVQGSCAPMPVLETIEPSRELTQYYSERQPRFRALYTALKPSFRD